MIVKKNVELAQFTTFRIGGPARFFAEVHSDSELLESIKFARQKKLNIFVLGGGSNLLVSDRGVDALVIKFISGRINYENKKVIALAGVLWDDLVKDTIEHGLNGLENLSAIPGTVGACPVQNIGAYGKEVADFIESVKVFDLKSDEFRALKKEECRFEYRDSLFKQEKRRYIITEVIFALKKDGKVNIEYKDLQEYFAKMKISTPIPAEVRKAVIEIRAKKLPNWHEWGTAGSFFKNPIICKEHYLGLKAKYPDLPGYPEGDDKFKVSLAWILDKVCGVKGLNVGNAYIYEKQALVIVTKAGAKADEVIELSKRIQYLVYYKTQINIEAEVEWVN